MSIVPERRSVNNPADLSSALKRLGESFRDERLVDARLEIVGHRLACQPFSIPSVTEARVLRGRLCRTFDFRLTSPRISASAYALTSCSSSGTETSPSVRMTSRCVVFIR